VSVLLASTAGEVIVWIVWVVAALALLASGFAVVLFSNPFYSALALIANLGSLAVLYLLLSAEFVAAAQVLVYAGAVMVMFLFVIAYIGHRADEPFAGGRSLARVAAIVAGGALLVEIVVVIVQDAGGRLSSAADITAAFGSPSEIGTLFLTDHLLAFEVTSIILLVGAVGGVVLGSGARRHRVEGDDSGENGRGPLSAMERPGGPRSSPTEVA
jgi:NADH:ubiquinone oxidoreductase subunit 6 (subunit J)